MPTYDYTCASCGHKMEVLHSVHDSGPSACPVCGGPMKKAFGVPAVHFKGSGWARKDRSTTNKPGRAERKDSGSGSDQGADSSPTGDSSKPPADVPATGSATTDSD